MYNNFLNAINFLVVSVILILIVVGIALRVLLVQVIGKYGCCIFSAPFMPRKQLSFDNCVHKI